MRQYNEGSGIKVLDRAVAIARSVAAGDKTLAELSDDTELPRATAHRIATALELHHVLARNDHGEWRLGPALSGYAAGPSPKLLAAAAPVMRELVAATGESAQLYQLTGSTRTCIAAEEPESGLHNVVPVGSRLTLAAGSAARVFAAHAPIDAPFDTADLERVRVDGFAESVAEREVGLASVSAPVFGPDGTLVAVLSISGPAERLRPSPAGKWGAALKDATARLSAEL
ncbi:IclR family transcriptional regulator [Corynebacterium lujinxingii]|uniref:IclR family transcriptional regulator n=1 Tax=Corynebacterium lujinxingii TaxID=2763010 RepID=A0A7H0K1K0_9CORY|nr:IclR family transcriptional regulator [Corynebacterium lujinxingii]MBC3178630.1 IclR family transcriptional regulator [Corynebacterium lujinxingii]NNO10438.1 helix-turn-helix domain-containing protein [Corynebacterium lujinxingii]QNP91166.1 IclR family transcriptional regulator [Corynebacterium lujinxingii]